MIRLYPPVPCECIKKVVFLIAAFLITSPLFAQPVITSFTPTSGPVGTMVTILGNNFSPVPAANTVYFGAVKAVVSAATPTSLTVTVPPGASMLPLTVTTGSLTAYAAQPFQVTWQHIDTPFNTASFGSRMDLALRSPAGLPNKVVSMDVDGDGRPDLITMSEARIAVFRNTSTEGALSFAPRADFTTSLNCISIATGDVDGDGKQDLVLQTGAMSLDIYKNTSTPGVVSFTGAGSYSLYSMGDAVPGYVMIRDINGDGKPDMATVNNTIFSSLIMFRNIGASGTISFNRNSYGTRGDRANNFSMGDIDGDNKQDLATINGKTVSVFANISTPDSLAFTKKADLTVPGDVAKSVAIGDVNGDDKPDLVVTNYNGVGSYVSVFVNIGTTGNFAFAAAVDYPAGSLPNALSIADLDGDGKSDLAVTSSNASQFSLLRNTGGAGAVSFAPAVNYPAPARTNGIAVSDLNGDNRPEVIVSLDNTLSVYKNRIRMVPNEPAVTSFSPVRAGKGDTITINGKNFSGTTKVRFGAITATSFTVQSDTVIKAVVDTGATGNVDVISPAGGDAITGFTFIPAPKVTAFTPQSGTVGTAVLISGKNFYDANNTGIVTGVWIGGVPVGWVYQGWPYTSIGITVKGGATGSVTVKTLGGTDSLPGFTWNEPLAEIYAFNPLSGGKGTRVTILGKNLAWVDTVAFGGVPADSFRISPSNSILSDSIIAYVGAGATGSLSLSTATGTTTRGTFTWLHPAPKIHSFSPASGPVGSTVTITGDNFSPILDSNMVYFGTVKAPVTAATATSLTVEVPVGSVYQPIIVTTHGVTVYSARPFITTFAGGGAITDSSFAAKVDYVAGTGLGTLIFTDLDDDRRLDMAIPANEKVTVFKNNSANAVLSFAGTTAYSVGDGPLRVLTRDLNGDGKQDLVTANYSEFKALSVVLNKSTAGNLSFDPFTVIPTSNLPRYDLGIADVNGDGRLEILLQSIYGKVSIYRNQTVNDSVVMDGPTAFGQGSTGAGTTGLITGDVDGDGRQDFVTIHNARMSIWRNTATNGVIAFAAPVEYPFYSGRPVATRGMIGDVDNDGKPDLVLATNSNSVAVYKNNCTNGVISFATPVYFPVTGGVAQIAMGDLDGDGSVDIAATIPAGKVISVLKNTTTGAGIAFAAKVDYPVGSNPQSICIGDLNSDGKPDMGVANGTDTISILINRINTGLQPLITSFTPDSAKEGDTIIIRGQRFTGATAVSFGGFPADTFNVVADTLITAVVGTGASGIISVSTPGGTATGNSFVFIASAPSITSFTPDSATMGTVITITGENFTNTSAVSLGGVPAASFTVLTATTIKAVAGRTGASGAISITTPGGTDTLAGYTFIPPAPSITSFTPVSGGAGATVTIRGDYFNGATAVSFGSVPATSFTVTDTMIMAVVDTGATGTVSITTPDGTGTLAGFTFIPPVPPAPYITSCTPLIGPTGTVVTITGKYFSGATAVRFGAVPAASFTVVSDTMITAVVGTGESGLIFVTTPDGIAQFAGYLFIPPAPSITSFTPASGTTGTQVTIRGERLRNTTAVTFGGVPAASFIMNDTMVIAVVGTGATGSVSITTHDGADSLAGFTFSPPVPSINSFTPASAAAGTEVTISGIHFTGATAVSFGGAPAVSFTVYSTNTIKATVGSGATGAIRVTTPNGTDTLAGFTFIRPLRPPVINMFAPASGGAGTSVTISGNYFTGATAVRFGGVPAASFTVASANTIIAVAGTGATGAISITTPDGTDSLEPFTFIQPSPQPVITGFTPTSATTGNAVRITGRYLTGATQIRFGGIAATSFTVTSDTVVNAFVGSGATGAISITAPGGTASLAGFTYIQPSQDPVISSFSPASAAANRIVTIRGLNLTTATQVSFGGVASPSFTVFSDTVILAYVGRGASGSVRVTTQDGAATLGGFTYLPPPPPVITGFSPASAAQGTSVTILGRYFRDATQVSFGGVAAGTFSVMWDSVIIANVGTGASGAVSVTTPTGTATADGFTFLQQAPAPAPVIHSFTPASGDSGTTVIITGRYFTGVTAVSFGGTTAASFLINSDSAITATVGSGSTGAVSVMSPDGTASLAGFTYIAPEGRMAAYPNPARGFVWLEHRVSTANAQIRIVDMMGNLVKTVKAETGAPKTQVDLNDIPPGYYRIVWSDNTSTTSKGIMIIQ